MPDLKLQCGGWTASLRPGAGGCIASLRLHGTEILRTMPDASDNALDAACFPLVPFCNRINQGRFSWQKTEVSLPANHPPEPHALHGFGWQEPWQAVLQTDWCCVLRHDHAGLGPAPWRKPISIWPWAYMAEQHIELSPEGLSVRLSVTNRSNVPMPAGLGLHPYFRRSEDTRLRFCSSGMIMVGPDMIPNGDIAASNLSGDWEHGATLPGDLIDNSFVLWDGKALIEDAAGTIEISASGAPLLHIYAPPDGKTLCLEPVTHAADAINTEPGDVNCLPPGTTATMEMRITAR